MEKGLRSQLVQISKDGIAKRKKLADALTNEELDYIKEHDKLATEFIEEMIAKFKEIMAGENDGTIHMEVDCGRIRYIHSRFILHMYVPEANMTNYPFFYIILYYI